ncbi:MAG: hypothetical protein FWD85_07115 [Microbacteriaceae bacterium]|nr:hypothetical protein [Microbacteriaceae bacterium]MCL2795060.1 hypothetical protein [Microbacteriaceae bacterium]
MASLSRRTRIVAIGGAALLMCGSAAVADSAMATPAPGGSGLCTTAPGAVPSFQQRFAADGLIDTFTVPDRVTSLTITAVGAQGGTTAGWTGGAGADLTETVDVTPGEVLDILVGEQGSAGATYSRGSGGGGGTFVFRGGTVDDLLIAAGGGGGASSDGWGNDAQLGAGGGSGNEGWNGSVAAPGFAGGTAGSGGLAPFGGGGGFLGDGVPSQGNASSGAGRAVVNGGAGGGSQGGFGGGAAPNGFAGGGGGGFSGGGTGGTGPDYAGGGGGGGSYSSVTPDSATPDNTSGNGWVALAGMPVAGPSLACQTLPAGTVGVAYSQQIAVSGGLGALTWAAIDGTSLPAGLSISPSGLVTGTPTEPFSGDVDVTVTDAGGVSASATLSFDIAAAPVATPTQTPAPTKTPARAGTPTPSPAPTLLLQTPGSAQVGGSFTLTGSGFAAGDYQVVLHSAPVTLGTVTAGGNGLIAATLAIPADVPTGAHTVLVEKDGVVVASAPLAVVPVTMLAATGTDAGPGLLIGLGALFGGVVLAGVAMRRRRARPSR